MSTAYTYNLNVGKVSALRKLVDHYEEKKVPVQLGDLKLTNSQYTNFCHLVYFGLAKHIHGGWLPTETGIAFIYGEVSVLVPVAVMNGVVLPLTHEAWATTEKQPKPVFVQGINETAYKKHEAYVQEVDVPRLV